MELLSAAAFFGDSVIFNKMQFKRRCGRWSDCDESPGPAARCSFPPCQECPGVQRRLLLLLQSSVSLTPSGGSCGCLRELLLRDAMEAPPLGCSLSPPVKQLLRGAPAGVPSAGLGCGLRETRAGSTFCVLKFWNSFEEPEQTDVSGEPPHRRENRKGALMSIENAIL